MKLWRLIVEKLKTKRRRQMLNGRKIRTRKKKVVPATRKIKQEGPQKGRAESMGWALEPMNFVLF